MKIISNKKWEYFEELEETNRELGNQILVVAENLEKANKIIDNHNKVIAELNDENNKLNKENNELVAKFELLNKEVEDLKKNVRKACACKNKKTENKVQENPKVFPDDFTKAPKKRGRKPRNAK